MTITNKKILIQTLKEYGEDYHFYPTTDKIINTLQKHLRKKNYGDEYNGSILEIGCGDGRVVSQLTTGDKYGIEKSKALISQLPADVFIVGTDFYSQSLIDKKTKVIYCNPPFNRGEYLAWMERIIKEANCDEILFVVPEEWNNSASIHEALKARKARKARKAQFNIIEKTNFDGCDRKANIAVDVLSIELRNPTSWSSEPITDPFDIWFDENFPIKASSSKKSEDDMINDAKVDLSNKIEAIDHENEKKATGNTSIVQSKGYISVLTELYNNDLNKLFNNYKALSEMDPEIVKETNISINSIKEAIKLKIKSKKYVYWNELFNNLTSITNRLTSAERKTVLDKIFENTSVDFTAENAHALCGWLIKNINNKLDDQFIAFYDKLSEQCNVELYKSNKRAFGDHDWSYRTKPRDLSHYKISTDKRIICEHITFNSPISNENLDESPRNLINDFMVIAQHVGFDTDNVDKANDRKWVAGKLQKFYYHDIETGKEETLLEVRVFKKGTIHIKANCELMLRINCMVGKIKGWIHTPQEAANEFDITDEKACELIGTDMRLTASQMPQLLMIA